MSIIGNIIWLLFGGNKPPKSSQMIFIKMERQPCAFSWWTISLPKGQSARTPLRSDMRWNVEKVEKVGGLESRFPFQHSDFLTFQPFIPLNFILSLTLIKHIFQTMLLNILFLFTGFVILIYGADKLVDGGSALASRLNVPNIVIGLTVVWALTITSSPWPLRARTKV